jgi:hypothetical protein
MSVSKTGKLLQYINYRERAAARAQIDVRRPPPAAALAPRSSTLYHSLCTLSTTSADRSTPLPTLSQACA